MAPRRIVRREFLGDVGRGVALGAFGLSSLASASTRPPRVAANDKIGFGLIGCGSLGRNHHLRNILTREDFEVRAVCDVDAEHVAQAVEMTEGKAAKYEDYRALLDRKDIDAVMIVTPDHWHALISVHACEAGKDVYCEKPLTLTVSEGRDMVNASRRYGRVFQTGSQQRSDHRFHWACDLVRNGHLGELKTIKAVIGRGPTTDWQEIRTPPEHLNWDLWLGPAPYKEYTPKRCHYEFRWIYDYSGGKMTDWGAHHLDIAQWAMGMDDSGPVEVEGSGTFPEKGLYDTAVTFDVRYKYENGVILHCTSEGENGVTFTGTKGEIFVSRGRISANPEEILDTEMGAGPEQLYHSRDHRGDWLDCIRTRKRPICDVEVGHRSATVCHIGNIALRLGRKLQWDPVDERFIGDEEANRFLVKPMRHPWTL